MTDQIEILFLFALVFQVESDEFVYKISSSQLLQFLRQLCFGRRKLKPNVRQACIQNFFILDLIVFEIAMKKTLNLCRFGRQTKLKHYLFLFLNLLVVVRQACIQNFIILVLEIYRNPQLERGGKVPSCLTAVPERGRF